MSEPTRNPISCRKHKTQDRKENCESYLVCLDFAVSRKRLNFSCLECLAFKEVKLPLKIYRSTDDATSRFSDGRVRQQKTRISDTLDLDDCIRFFKGKE